MRNIPATMATQHPDNAAAPYWAEDANPFIGVYKEIPEALYCFRDLGVSEFMWDWEGKHADAAVVDRLLSDHYDYFSKVILGKDKFLTFRIPNIWEETGYNLLQAMSVILSSEDLAEDLNLSTRPLFEIILPMTEKADQLIHMQKLFQKLARFKSTEFTSDRRANSDYLEMIPLVESVESQLAIATLLGKFVDLHKAHFKRKPEYIRPFMARSDPALVSGNLATVLANKLAISRVYEFSNKTKIPIFPISGVGSLPFRGGLTPATVDDYLAEYPGMRTASVQSSFRYDSSIHQVKSAINKLEIELPKTKPRLIPANEQKLLEQIISNSAKCYQSALQSIAEDLLPIFSLMPRRRDRRQHIGLLSYGRSMSGIKLPRAITYTAGFYSIGFPPELLGIGQALQRLNPFELDLVKATYVNFLPDLEIAGGYLNKTNISKLAKSNPAWHGIAKDIALAESLLGIDFEPKTPDQKTHQELSAKLLQPANTEKHKALIEEMASLRRSLG